MKIIALNVPVGKAGFPSGTFLRAVKVLPNLLCQCQTAYFLVAMETDHLTPDGLSSTNVQSRVAGQNVRLVPTQTAWTHAAGLMTTPHHHRSPGGRAEVQVGVSSTSGSCGVTKSSRRSFALSGLLNSEYEVRFELLWSSHWDSCQSADLTPRCSLWNWRNTAGVTHSAT